MSVDGESIFTLSDEVVQCRGTLLLFFLIFLLFGDVGPLSTVVLVCAIHARRHAAVAYGLSGIVPLFSASVILNSSGIGDPSEDESSDIKFGNSEAELTCDTEMLDCDSVGSSCVVFDVCEVKNLSSSVQYAHPGLSQFGLPHAWYGRGFAIVYLVCHIGPAMSVYSRIMITLYLISRTYVYIKK